VGRGGPKGVEKLHQMSHRGGGSKKCGKSVVYYWNGRLENSDLPKYLR
jgi:hypothetical protein